MGISQEKPADPFIREIRVAVIERQVERNFDGRNF